MKYQLKYRYIMLSMTRLESAEINNNNKNHNQLLI